MLDPGDYDGTYDPGAGRLCLDFANTLGDRTGDRPHEWLSSYANLVAWGKLAGALSAEAAASLRREAREHPADASRVLGEAIQLREVIYGIFSAVAAGHEPQPTILEKLNKALPEALAHRQIVPVDGEFAWDWVEGHLALDRMLWPVLDSAAELLTSDSLNRVGECKSEGCGWLFMDMSRNHSRRWCDMGDCGNREKARRHYKRKRKSEQKQKSKIK